MVQVLMFPNLPAQAAALAVPQTTPMLIHQRGRVVAPLSYRGMTIGRARALCPEAQVHVRQPVYAASASQVHAVADAALELHAVARADQQWSCSV